MAQATKVGIVGGGWPAAAHAKGYLEAGGFKVIAVADLIPARRKALMQQTGATREFADAEALVADKEIEAVSVCLPTHLHAPIALAALRAGKHVCCEKPPALNAKDARKLEATATRYGKTLLYSMQRRFGGAEQASKQAIEKGYIGDAYHARASWMRTRGIPAGTGWFTDKTKSGGGAMIDIGVPILDLAWHLLGQPKPVSVFATTHQRFKSQVNESATYDVEDAGFALIRFEGGKSLELSASWALNQPPSQQGTLCRVYGEKGAVDVYTPEGGVIYRSFDAKGAAKPVALKPPRVTGHAAMMRHFRACMSGQGKPLIGGNEGIALMQIVEGIYASSEKQKSVEIK